MFIILPAIVAIIGTIIYFFHGLDETGAWLTIILSALAFFVMYKKLPKTGEKNIPFFNLKHISPAEWTTSVIFVVAWIASVWFLYQGRSYRAIVSPWQVVSIWYFLTYCVGVGCLFFLAKKSSSLTTFFLVMQSLLLFGTAVLVYTIGYGFDPYVHDAAVRSIEQLGQIKPLTPYYIGQYSLLIVLKTLTGIAASTWSKILVPALAALLLPFMLTRWLREKNRSLLPLVFLLIFPLPLFIVTTPQSLAYIFLLVIIFLPASDNIVKWLCALAALTIQPLAGIPALLLVIRDWTIERRLKIHSSVLLALFIVVLPAVLYVFSALNATASVSLTWPNLAELFSWLALTNPTREIVWLNFLYFYSGFALLLFVLASVAGIVFAHKKNYALVDRLGWPALALVLSSILASSIHFHFLIEYEQSDYPLRLLIIAALFALPFVLVTFSKATELYQRSDRLVRNSIFCIVVAGSVAALYFSYPRNDHYYNSHGYATSKADILAVHWIEQDSQGKPYIVLSDQQVSAAALREFGFAHYYKNNLFYYAVPTGGPLYQNYLAFTDQPNKKNISAARDLSGVQTVYIVINSYWWQYKKIAPEAAKLADKTKDIGDGQISIFVFDHRF